MHLLIPYKPLINHVDPDFREYTYGDSSSRAIKLRTLKTGDYVFFHTTIKGNKYITAYYVVDRVLDTASASKDRAITIKYKNPHILEHIRGLRANNGEVDVVLFGDPIKSYILDKPILFDKKLAELLSLNIIFNSNFSDARNIGSATRSWRSLSNNDIEVLLNQISSDDGSATLMLKTTEEVSQILERDIENHLAHDPAIIGSGFKLVGRQLCVPSGRIDLLVEDENCRKYVVEIKLGRIGRDAISQLRGYIKDLRSECSDVEGIIVCEGILPAYEEEYLKLNKIQIFKYGWSLGVQRVN